MAAAHNGERQRDNGGRAHNGSSVVQLVNGTMEGGDAKGERGNTMGAQLVNGTMEGGHTMGARRCYASKGQWREGTQ